VNDSFNPYLPPKANLESADGPREIEPVGRWLRFGTLVIDSIVMYALEFCVLVVLALAFGNASITALDGVSGWLFGLVFGFTYYVFFEGIWGRTPGKFVCGTIVVTEDGTKPSLGRIAQRSLCRYIPFEPFSFFGERGARGWHDSISKTCVVSARG
jgi:uncharacterized RDD family membrane protein YckC